jgi:DNA-binding beta-propeller fold protein YncE
VDPVSNNIVAAVGNCIEIFTSSGGAVTSFGSFNKPWGVAVDANENIYVSDSQKNLIQVFNSTYSPVTQWGSAGNGSGQFDMPLGIALDNGGAAGASVYVADNVNQRVQKFTHNGTYVTQWGGFIAYPTPYPSPSPTGIAVDSSDHIYVTDNAPSILYEFDSNGNPITLLHSPEFYIPQAIDPDYQGIAIGPSGNIYILCAHAAAYGFEGRIRKYDSSFNYLGDFGQPGMGGPNFDSPVGIAIDNSGNIYVSDYGWIDKFSP